MTAGADAGGAGIGDILGGTGIAIGGAGGAAGAAGFGGAGGIGPVDATGAGGGAGGCTTGFATV